MKIGVLAIQGDVIEHINSLKKINSRQIEVIKVRLPEDLKDIKGLIIPGGESTTLMKLIKRYRLDTIIRSRFKNNKLAIFGTCAGAIVLSKKITNYPNQPSLDLLDIEIQRNAYGRQLDSFEKNMKILDKKINCVFIRAPVIKNISKDIRIIKELDTPIMIEQGNILVTTFHPELSETTLVHKYFIDMCKKI